MKKILIVPIILLICSCSTIKTTLTENGKKNIGTLVGGLKQGRWNSYEDGQLISTGNYSDGKQTGYWKYFYPNGRIHRKGKFINDKAHGFWYYYFDNGQLMGKGDIINDEQNKVWKWFYNNGNLYTERLYDHGKLLEIKSCFDNKGGQLDCGSIINGNGIMISHDVESKTDTLQRFEFVNGLLKEK